MFLILAAECRDFEFFEKLNAEDENGEFRNLENPASESDEQYKRKEFIRLLHEEASTSGN
jgi:hypothetical protein